jgi:NAD(P)-dependent dehydrogenase (short-subunit alcohol dehydrogenase family)
MLAGCTRKLLDEGWRVHAIARSQRKLDALGAGSSGLLTTASCDYHDLDAFERALVRAQAPVSAILYWIHSSGQDAIDLINARFADIDRCRVVGSEHRLMVNESSAERIVKLGFVSTIEKSRWLTHDEISDGVFRAFVAGDTETIVGVVEPWGLRPQ